MTVIEFMESTMLTCWFKAVTGLDCPGCGMQRSAIALLRGELVESAALYPPLIPTLITFLLLGIHVVKPMKHSLLFLKLSYIFTAFTILINYILKFF